MLPNRKRAILRRSKKRSACIPYRGRAPRSRLRGRASRSTEDYLFFIYYFPLYDIKDEASVRSEIDIIVSKNIVATVHYEPLKSVFGRF